MIALSDELKAERPQDIIEAAEYLRISATTLKLRLKAGKIKGAKIGREWRIAIEELRRATNPE
jgi:excisionase family DNA binding protein